VSVLDELKDNFYKMIKLIHDRQEELENKIKNVFDEYLRMTDQKL
jgi:Mg2+ and Co2+ transporter CorA